MRCHLRNVLVVAGGALLLLLSVPARAEDPAPTDPPTAGADAKAKDQPPVDDKAQSPAAKDVAPDVRNIVPTEPIKPDVPASGPAGVLPNDTIGTVKSVDPIKLRMVIIEDGTGIEREIALATATPIAVVDKAGTTKDKGKKLALARIKPGSRVVVHDLIEAAAVRVEGQVLGSLQAIDLAARKLVLLDESTYKQIELPLASAVKGIDQERNETDVTRLLKGSRVVAMREGASGPISKIVVEAPPASIVAEFFENFRHNLFKPLLLFFFMGFIVPIIKVEYEFPYVIYQGLVTFLLVSIGWHGGEELAELESGQLLGALGFMGTGFVMNFVNGIVAYLALSLMTRMRRVDKATVAGYYGSDSAGTYATCVGALAAAGIAFEAYMPVMLAVMEIPGCLVALYLVSRLRHGGMDALGHMPDEPGYDPNAKAPAAPTPEYGGHGSQTDHGREHMALEKKVDGEKAPGLLSAKLLHEVFLNPGLYLLFGGIAIGWIGRAQGVKVTADQDNFFNVLFQGVLCLFLLEMGMTASRKLKDLRSAGAGFIAFGLLMPNVFATAGICVAHLYSHLTRTPFQLGTYVLFSVLCGSASYIAVPAVQRLAIPEASPTLPLAASLGLTFTYNVTIGIAVYIEIAKALMRVFPV